MKLTCLTLQNFRNIEYEKIYFSDGVNILVGKNAQGKTNILEAINFCSYLKSFRSCSEQQLIMIGKEFAKIKLEYKDFSDNCVIEIKIFKTEPKQLKINGITVAKNRQFIGQFLSIVFTPDHLNLIKEGPNKRRSFLDMALCALDIKYTDALLKYQKILAQRNAVLKKSADCFENSLLLDIYDQNLAKEGAYIAYSRAKYIEKLEPFAKKIFMEMTKTDIKLKLLYINQFLKTADCCEDFETAILERLRKKRQADIIARVTQSGIQKDDILILGAGKSLKHFGSQGQIRCAVLSLILAQSKVIYDIRGDYPVIILDDILSELDRTRKAFIFKGLENTQCILSTCEAQKVKNRGNILKVSKGRII